MITKAQAAMYSNLASALVDASTRFGKEDETRDFIVRMQKECPTQPDYERALVCAYADGILYGNWPWVQV